MFFHPLTSRRHLDLKTVRQSGTHHSLLGPRQDVALTNFAPPHFLVGYLLDWDGPVRMGYS